MADNAKPVEARKVEDRTHYLYIAVIVAMLAGIAVGALWPEFPADHNRVQWTAAAKDICAEHGSIHRCRGSRAPGSVRRASRRPSPR